MALRQYFAEKMQFPFRRKNSELFIVFDVNDPSKLIKLSKKHDRLHDIECLFKLVVSIGHSAALYCSLYSGVYWWVCSNCTSLVYLHHSLRFLCIWKWRAPARYTNLWRYKWNILHCTQKNWIKHHNDQWRLLTHQPKQIFSSQSF